MKIVQAPVYQAFDGTQFTDEAACLAHEEHHWTTRFVDLTPAKIAAAFDRTDKELADAFERAGRVIGDLRLEQGERRRGPNKPKVEDAPATPPAVSVVPPPGSYAPNPSTRPPASSLSSEPWSLLAAG